MSDELKTWAAVDAGTIVHAGFSAPQSYIDSYDETVVEREDRTTPPWYHEGITFLDITNMNPRPGEGWFKNAAGKWVDGNATLTTDRNSVPADGTTFATVTFAQLGPKAPQKVKFNANGTEVEDALVNGKAVLTVSSSTPGDQILVSANGLSLVIQVEV